MMKTLLALSIALTLAVTTAAAADPTRPPSPAEIRAWFDRGADRERHEATWTLQTVLVSDDRSLAIINGQRVRSGESIDGASVISIEPGRVVLEHDGERMSLTMDHGRESVRQTTSN